MTGDTPLLQVTGLQAGYGDVQVLWGIDLTVMAGQITCVVGSNGAGKTTLLRTISGLIAPRAASLRAPLDQFRRAKYSAAGFC